MIKAFTAFALLSAIALVSSEVYFKETFDATWEKRWTHSTWKKADNTAAEFKLSAGKWFADEEADKGIQTSEDSKFYAISAPLTKQFDNTKKDLVLQFSVKHQQDLDCGGGYIKLIPASAASKMKDFGGDTPYSIMFGPDICGYSTKKVHVILTYKGKNHLIKHDIPAETDTLTHVYTLVLHANNTYKVLIDLVEKRTGSLEEDWDLLAPKKIKDPKASKPEDWDERPKIDDPEDVKPAGWDDIPATIADPDATKPADWNDEEDGTWEAPTKPNPDFKGDFKAKQIDNPAYKGIWVAPDIDNPEFKPDPLLYNFKDSKFVGFELWQVKSGSIFDNIFVSDDLTAAEKFAEETWGKGKDAEKAAYEKIKEAEKADAAAKAATEKPADDAAAAAGEPTGDDEHDDYDYPTGKEEL